MDTTKSLTDIISAAKEAFWRSAMIDMDIQVYDHSQDCIPEHWRTEPVTDSP
jgi:hypothetical protein